jgi:hypothetical protein
MLNRRSIHVVDSQLPLPGLSRNPAYLTSEENKSLSYFSAIDPKCLSPVANLYVGVGPKGYGVSLILAWIIKIKERILSDRQLAKAPRKNDLCRFVTQNIQPSHNTFHTLRQRLDINGYIKIHKHIVTKAPSLGLLAPEIRDLPKTGKGVSS